MIFDNETQFLNGIHSKLSQFHRPTECERQLQFADKRQENDTKSLLSSGVQRINGSPV